MIKTTLMTVFVFAALAAFNSSRSHAVILAFDAFLSGPSEAPANASPGTGSATVAFDTVAHTMQLHVDFISLIGTTTAAHIHAPTAVALAGTASVATTTPTFAGFPAGVTSGTYDVTLDMTLTSSYNPTFVAANGTPAGAEAALLTAMIDGKSYLNIHTTAFPGGEIRGFLMQVPEPSTWMLMVTGVAAVAAARRKRR